MTVTSSPFVVAPGPDESRPPSDPQPDQRLTGLPLEPERPVGAAHDELETAGGR
jgi:hypothetical protein